jgi:hypothetical protein
VGAKFLQNMLYFLLVYDFFCIFAAEKDFRAGHARGFFDNPIGYLVQFFLWKEPT